MNYRNYTATQTTEWYKMEFQEAYSNDDECLFAVIQLLSNVGCI